MRQLWKLFAVSFLAVASIGNASAEWSAQFGVEAFRWQEFDSTGRLLEETGPRFRGGATWRRSVGIEQRDLLEVRGDAYIANIDYDGQACDAFNNCTPYMTDANYFGLAGEATYSHRLGSSRIGEIFGGGGIDVWRRDIRGSATVSGAVENWTVLYVLGGGGAGWSSRAARFRVQAGLKYPFYAANYAKAFDVTVEPKGRISPFARFTTDFIHGGLARWGIGVYYDTYRFDMSNAEQAGPFLVWQPESHQDVLGAFASVYF